MLLDVAINLLALLPAIGKGTEGANGIDFRILSSVSARVANHSATESSLVASMTGFSTTADFSNNGGVIYPAII